MINLFSKHVVFGHVISGQSVVDTIENLSVDSKTNRPLKDVVISNCGQLENVKSKKRQISIGDESENVDNDSSSSTSDNDEKKKKSKHNKKSNKKEKHRRKKETKRSAKKINEDDNDITGRDNTSHKSNIDPDDISDISEQKVLMRSALNDKEKTTNNDEKLSRYDMKIKETNYIQFFSTNSYRAATKVDSNGRPVKGRGIMVRDYIFFIFI